MTGAASIWAVFFYCFLFFFFFYPFFSFSFFNCPSFYCFQWQHIMRSSSHVDQSGAALSGPIVRVSAEHMLSSLSRTLIKLLKENKYRRPHGKNPSAEHLVSDSLIGQWKTCVVQVPFDWSTWSRCHPFHVIMFTVYISVRCTFLLPERPQRWRTALT